MKFCDENVGSPYSKNAGYINMKDIKSLLWTPLSEMEWRMIFTSLGKIDKVRDVIVRKLLDKDWLKRMMFTVLKATTTNVTAVCHSQSAASERNVIIQAFSR